jgi:hypothetical protein
MNKCAASSEGCGLHMTHEGVAGQPLRRRLSAVLILLCSSSLTKKRTFGGACIVHVVAKCGECIPGLLRKSYADLDEYVVVDIREHELKTHSVGEKYCDRVCECVGLS